MRYAMLLVVIGLAATHTPAQSVSFELVPDIPTDLSGATRLPWEIVDHDAGSGSYGSTLVLPENPAVDALHRMDNGDWLISLAVPTNLGGTEYSERDLVRYDGAAYSLFFDGVTSGIPAGSDIDAVFLAAGDPVVSFDIPTTIAGTTYGSSDLVRFTAGVDSLLFDAGSAGIPPASNVVGADGRGSGVALTFDVPTDLSGSTYLPGQLCEWDGANFALLHHDGAWPLSSAIEGFSLTFVAPPGPGAIAATLRLSKAAPSTVDLSWSASCGLGAADYGIYEGQLGSWSSHTMVDCTDDGGDLTENVTPGAGSRYFLVVPHDAVGEEGSYGTGAGGADRGVGATTCQSVQAIAQCQ